MRNLILSTLSPPRAEHVLLTEKAAVALCERWGEDAQKGSTAALLHDITKEKSLDEHMEICKKYGLTPTDIEMREPKTLHQRTGGAVANNEFGIKDEDILSAIKYHTTGREGMSLLEKIIFIADYIEDSRDFKRVDELRETAFRDIDEAMILGLAHTIKKITKKKKMLHVNTVNAYNYHINKRGTD